MRIGLIGFGAMGKNHYRVLKTIPEVELVAVCDTVLPNELPERRYQDCTDMLEEEELDAAIVAVPTSSHHPVALEVIRHNVALFVEKPIASSVAQAQEIIDAASAQGIRAAVGHVERFNPVVRSLIQELAEKEIYSISITRIGPFPPRINDVGVLVDLSVHDIDLVHCLTGSRSVTEARIYQSIKCAGNREDNAVITFRLDNDVVASIITNWLTPFKKRTIEVATDAAFYSADLISQELIAYSAYMADSSYLVRNCPVRKGEPLRGELDAFIRFVRTGDRGGLASLHDGLRPLQVIYRRCASEPARTNGLGAPALR